MDMARDNDFILEMLRNLNDKQDKQTEKLDRIEMQTTRTNGRVTALEGKMEKVKVQISKFRSKKPKWYETIDPKVWTAVALGLILAIVKLLTSIDLSGLL